MQNIQLSYPNYFIFFIVIIALVYAISLYVNERKLKENKSWLPSVLGILRFLGVMLILFLLLGPLLKFIETEEEKPRIIFLQDRSNSINAASDSTVLQELQSQIETLKQEIEAGHIIETFEFGQGITSNELDSLNAMSTNISSVLEYISENYEDQNVGSIILSSDGIYNEGKNPLYADLQLSVPIHTIALGDTSRRRDILIKNILHNRIVYLNDRFRIESDIQAYNAKGAKSELVLSRIINGNKQVLQRQNINIDNDRFFETYAFELEANQVGNVKYLLEVTSIPNELSYLNNRRNIYIEVLDSRQKVLLFANSVHPDIKLIKKLITANKNYEIDVVYADKALSSADSYDAVILHNLPSADNNIEAYIQNWQKEKIPLFFVMGSQTDRGAFNTSQSVLNLTGESFSLNNVTPVINLDFSPFTNSDAFTSRVNSFVPLKSPYGEYQVDPAAQVLLFQKIGSVETPFPLLAYNDVNGHKQAVLAGEGIWRWGLMEYFESENQDMSKELITKSIQYISQKEDKRKFRAFSNKRDYRENESISLDAQLYNDNYELINSPDVNLVISNQENERFEYIFTKSQDFYVLNAGRFPEGEYRFTASTEYNGNQYTSGGSFSVQSIMKEEYDLTARHDILNQISINTGGQMFYPENASEIASVISNDNNIKTVMYQKAVTKPIIEWPWLLGIVILILAIEWFMRRYFGAY